MPSSVSGQPFRMHGAEAPKWTRLPDYLQRLPKSMRVKTGHGNSHTFLTHEFIAAIVEDREPAIDIYESLAMTVPGIIAHQSALKGGEQLPVPSFHGFAEAGWCDNSYCPAWNLLIGLSNKNGRALFFESILLSLLPQPTRVGLIHGTTD